MQEEKEEILIAPKGKGFKVFRGDAVTKTKSNSLRTLYDIGKPLRPSIVRSWTTSHKIAKRFACEYIDGREERVAPIIYHGLTNKMKKGLFWDSEREVYILRGKSKLKEIEIVKLEDCKKILEELRK